MSIITLPPMIDDIPYECPIQEEMKSNVLHYAKIMKHKLSSIAVRDHIRTLEAMHKVPLMKDKEGFSMGDEPFVSVAGMMGLKK